MKEIHLIKKYQTYKLELKYIAENRANYYANREHGEESKKKYKSEYDYTMEDYGVAYNWLLNNTNPCDFKGNIHLIKTEEIKDPTSWDDYDDII